MKVVVFGATGMIGQGVLRECLLASDVTEVLTVGRRATGQTGDKLSEVVHADPMDYTAIEARFDGFDACFFCLGVSSAGMSEADYRRVTFDYGVAAARALVARAPAMTFIFVSGAGTDATSRTMWARVKGEAEEAIFGLPFRAAYAFRPAFIRPLHGIRSRTALYNALYTVVGPAFPLLERTLPRYVTTTEAVGRAMLHVARSGYDERILENDDINAVAARATGG